MPLAAPKPCSVCSALVRDGSSRCQAHKLLATNRFGDKARGSRHARGYGTAWDKLRLFVLARDCGICQPCQAIGVLHEGTHVDHKVNKAEWKRLHGSLAGVDDPDNLQAINVDCHQAKTAREAARGRGGSNV